MQYTAITIAITGICIIRYFAVFLLGEFHVRSTFLIISQFVIHACLITKISLFIRSVAAWVMLISLIEMNLSIYFISFILISLLYIHLILHRAFYYYGALSIMHCTPPVSQ